MTSFETLRPYIEKIMQAKFSRAGKVGNAYQIFTKGKTEENLRRFLALEALMKKVGVDHNWLNASDHGVGCTFKQGQEHLVVNFLDDQLILSMVY